MIIWSGWGILVPLFLALGLGVGVVGVSATGIPDPWGPAIGFCVAGVLSGLAIFFTARSLDGREGRVLLDEKTGQRIMLKPTAGSFFFIPTRYWAFVAPVAGVLMGLLMALSPN